MVASSRRPTHQLHRLGLSGQLWCFPALLCWRAGHSSSSSLLNWFSSNIFRHVYRIGSPRRCWIRTVDIDCRLFPDLAGNIYDQYIEHILADISRSGRLHRTRGGIRFHATHRSGKLFHPRGECICPGSRCYWNFDRQFNLPTTSPVSLPSSGFRVGSSMRRPCHAHYGWDSHPTHEAVPVTSKVRSVARASSVQRTPIHFIHRRRLLEFLHLVLRFLLRKYICLEHACYLALIFGLLD